MEYKANNSLIKHDDKNALLPKTSIISENENHFQLNKRKFIQIISYLN